MEDEFLTDHPDLEKLFEKLDKEPGSLVFAPLADSCRKAGRLEEALEICVKGVSEHPDYTSGHVVLGKCYYDNSEIAKASETFQKVLNLDENNLVALKYLGMILAEEGNELAAMEHFRHILALDPENTEIRMKLESLQGSTMEPEGSNGGDEDEEVVQLESMPDEDFEGKTISLGDDRETSDEIATLTLADIYASQGYIEKAKKIYENVLKNKPNNSLAKEKLAALQPENRPSEEHVVEEEDSAEFAMEELMEGEQETKAGEAVDGFEESSVQTTEETSSLREDSSESDTASSSTVDHEDREAVDSEEEVKSTPIDEESSFQHFKKWIQRMDD